MIRGFVLLAIVASLAVSSRAAVTNLVQLREQLSRTLATVDTPGDLWAMKVSSLRTGRSWFETNAATRLTPASNAKLFTAALALDRLGADRRLATSLQATAAPDASGRLAGSLRIVGGGDPTWCPRLRGGSWQQTWAPLVQSVQNAGIRRVDGDLICDESRFNSPPYGRGWNWDDLAEYYGAAVSALSAGDNAVTVIVTPGPTPGAPATARLDPPVAVLSLDLRVATAATGSASDLTLFRLPGDSRLRVSGSVPKGGRPVNIEASVPSPALWFGTLFGAALKQAGVTVSGRLRVVTSAEDARKAGDGLAWREIATVPSPPVGDLVREMMKPSQNLYAQLLLLAVGAEAGRSPETTEEAGLRAMDGLLRTAGIESEDVRLEEGSGLSRKNLVTPRAVVRLLEHMARHRWAGPWRASLPVGGEDGTLRQRFTQPGLKGNVRAKTGTMSHVSTLSGYLTNSVGEPLVFSILVNNHVPSSGRSARDEIDALVAVLAQSAVRAE